MLQCLLEDGAEESAPPSPPLGDCIERRQQLASDARRQHRCVLCGGCRLRRDRHSPKANVIHKTPQHLSCHQTSPTKICLPVCHVAKQTARAACMKKVVTYG